MSLYDDILSENGELSHSNAKISSVRTAASVAVAPPQVLRRTTSQRAQNTPSKSLWASGDIRSSVDGLPCPQVGEKKAENQSRDTSSRKFATSNSSWIGESAGNEYDPLAPNEYGFVKSQLINVVSLPEKSSPTTCSSLPLAQGDIPNASRDDLYCASSSKESSSDAEYTSDYGSDECSVLASTFPAKSTMSCNTAATPLDVNPAVSGMMAKMGWTQGTGLGISQQGRVDPVIASGNDGRGGLGKWDPVVPFTRKDTTKHARHPKPHRGTRRVLSSRVLFIQNLPAGVAPQFEADIRRVCQEFGQIEDVIMKDTVVADDSFPEGIRVTRAFVVFGNASSASAAIMALDNALHFGCHLRVSLYPESLLRNPDVVVDNDMFEALQTN